MYRHDQPAANRRSLRVILVHTLSDVFPSIRRSTLTFIRRGATLARVAGELHFDRGIRLVVRERLTFDRLPGTIESYGYEVWRGEQRIYWYDSQPHPDDPELQSTHPHHKHLHPDIKRHRIPAPGISLSGPNLPFLIREIEELIR